MPALSHLNMIYLEFFGGTQVFNKHLDKKLGKNEAGSISKSSKANLKKRKI